MTQVLMLRVIKLLWAQVGDRKNPWTRSAASGDEPSAVKCTSWSSNQLALLRDMYRVVFVEGEPSARLIERALDFLDGAQ
jgi:hypothetical protein